ncbi:hypothetical protein ElyMa_003456700 [Elysia marginata]|uniref:Uncharacterized protein n=1 Tax=Elysia marginata TaxID=1093978 RepID=A0AAV4E888_9GAST|nr:hypothetical protein ElyMa_003456700 [Elysia marginata]
MDGAIALAMALTCRKRRTCKKKRTKWPKQWFLNRAKFGHIELLKELRDNEPDDYKNFLRMDGDCFNEVLEMVEPHIKKEDTVMRKAIPPVDRLSLTLRFLATGNNRASKHHCNDSYTSAVPAPDFWESLIFFSSFRKLVLNVFSYFFSSSFMPSL